MSRGVANAELNPVTDPAAAALRRDLDDLVFEAELPVQQLLDVFRAIESIDRYYEPLDRRWRRMKYVSGLATFFSLPLAIFTGGAGLALTFPLLIAFVSIWIVHGRYAPRNLPDRRYRIPAELLRFLGVDIDPESRVAARIDFNAYRNRRYLTAKGKQPGDSTVTNYDYELPWFSLRGTLLDGSRFRLKIQYAIKRKEKRKRKYVKVTETFREKMNLTILVRPNRYPGVSRFPALLARTEPPAGLHAPRAQVDGRRIIIQAMTPPRKSTVVKDAENTSDRHSVLQLFLASYRCLQQCRTA